MESTTELAWHFVRREADGGPMLRDGRKLVVGEWLEEPGAKICERGLHASREPLDALSFVGWEGGFVCLVECDQIVAEQKDKLVCKRRRARFALPCDELLRDFARHAALTVLPLWPDAPPIVREYLETGNEEIRSAAWAAAARSAPWAAASCAAWTAAARSATWAAADGSASWAAAARSAAAMSAAACAALNGDLESMILASAVENGWAP